MIKIREFILSLFIMSSLISFGFAQEQKDSSVYLDFRNQKVSDIIYSLAELCGESVFIDETVTGNATFHFEDKDFYSALKRFADYYQLFLEDVNGIYTVSKVKIESKENKLSLNTENVEVEKFLTLLSRKTETTIMYDNLPKTNVTIRVKDVSLEDILNFVIVKLPGFGLERISDGYYISKNQSSNNSKRNIDVFNLSKVGDNYSLSIQKATFSTVIDALFKKAGKEYSLLVRPSMQLENLFYTNKSFDSLLMLLLQPVNCDFTITDDVYYILEIQKKDILKKYKQTKVIKIKNIRIEDITTILPQDFNSSGFMKIDVNTSSVILNGTNDEIAPIENFLISIDVPCNDRIYRKYNLKNIKVSDAITIIPKVLLLSDIIPIPQTNSFITLTNGSNEEKLLDFINTIDNKNTTHAVKLKYIKSEDLMKNLPPSVDKENITETIDASLVFFKGNEEQFQLFSNDLKLIDKPKQQIKYQILVIQRQKTSGLNWGTQLTINNTGDSASIKHSTLLSNVFNINFDIVSQFGLQFAGQLNAELSNGKSHVLADTTLNGISGEKISFSNTNTYRYRDIIVNTDGELYTSTTRELASGLTLSISGWVSGDDMITVSVDAQVSKQGSTESSSSGSGTIDTTTPPSTSEKKVMTNVRTQSGEPIVIGGLYQQEDEITEKRIPVLGYIPILGNLFKTKKVSIADTEFIIYLVPFVEKDLSKQLTSEETIEKLYMKYISNLETNNE